jgi:glycosyltransferase involved in cell wall biosynthesis
MAERSLRIAWVGAGPPRKESGGVPGVARELLHGLAALGHRIDCYQPGVEREVPGELAADPNIDFIWGDSGWRWNRWYSRTNVSALASGLFARALASLRLRREIGRRHRAEPYDVVFQLSNIEALAMPPGMRAEVPLVIQPETHIAGELKALLAERRLALRCQPARVLVPVVAIMSVRALVQRLRVRRASLLICISEVFRDHLVRDYGYPRERTVVIPNPVRVERFSGIEHRGSEPPRILVLGRVAARKGVEDVLALAHVMLQRRMPARIRVVGGPDLQSDYTGLMAELPSEIAEYAGRIPPPEIPAELARADVLLQPSRYEPFALTVAEALAAGVPVVATTEVGASEGVDPAVAARVAPGDVEAMADAVVAMLQRSARDPEATAATARAEASRLFATEVVRARISSALQALVQDD